MSRMLVLDFDGTCTDAEAEGAPFRAGYMEDLAAYVGLPLERVLARAEEIEAEVASSPTEHGWTFNGHIVAPSSVDPYLRVMPIARRILDDVGSPLDDQERADLLDIQFYGKNYGKTGVCFRDGAAEVLAGLEGTRTWIVTNSHTEPVQDKLRALGADWLVPRVHGLARKYVLDPGFDAVSEQLWLPGLERPVLLRRRLYHDVLKGLLDEAGLHWSDLVVVGDIFELDLALPLAMGARVGFMANQFSPRYERDFVEGHERGAVLDSVRRIPAFARLNT